MALAAEAVDSGRAKATLEKFQSANELIPSPHAEYWIALSLDKLEKLEETIAAYETFLQNPDAAKAE